MKILFQWISLLPIAIICFVIVDVLLRLLFGIAITSGEEEEQLVTNSGLFADFIAGACYIIVGTSIAPNFKVLTSISLTIIFIGLNIYISFFQAIPFFENIFIPGVIAGTLGEIVGLIYIIREIKKEKQAHLQ